MLAKLALHLPADFRPPTTVLDQIANAELVVGMALIVAFTIFYGIRFRWYRTPPSAENRRGGVNFAGIAIFSVFSALSLLLIFSFTTRLLTPGDYLFRDLYRVIVYFALPASGAFLFVALFISREQMLRELRASAQAEESLHVDPEVQG